MGLVENIVGANIGQLMGGNVVELLIKVGVLLTCFWFGKKALTGYRKKLNSLLRIVGAVVIGVFCYVTGMIISKYIPLLFSEFLGAGVSTIIVFIILRLISPHTDLESKFVSRDDYHKLLDDFEKLKQRVAKMEKALSDKGMNPEPLSDKKIKNIVNTVLNNREYSRGEVLSKKLSGNEFELVVASESRKFDVILNAYSGDLLQFKRHVSTKVGAVKAFFEELLHNKNYLLATLIFTGFVLFVAQAYAPSDYDKLMITWGEETINAGCPSPSELDSLFGSGNADRYDLPQDFVNQAGSVLNATVQPVYGYRYQGVEYAVVTKAGENCSVNLGENTLCSCE